MFFLIWNCYSFLIVLFFFLVRLFNEMIIFMCKGGNMYFIVLGFVDEGIIFFIVVRMWGEICKMCNWLFDLMWGEVMKGSMGFNDVIV